MSLPLIFTPNNEKNNKNGGKSEVDGVDEVKLNVIETAEKISNDSLSQEKSLSQKEFSNTPGKINEDPKPEFNPSPDGEAKHELKLFSDDDDDDNDNLNTGHGFSDSNKNWLKLKNNLDDDDDEGEEDKDDEGKEGGEDEEGEELLDIEKKAIRLDKKKVEEEREAHEEFMRSIANRKKFTFSESGSEKDDDDEETGEKEQDEDDVGEETDISHLPAEEIREKIQGILEIFRDFKNNREPGRSRKDYLDMFLRYTSEYFGYLTELTELFLGMFSPEECFEFMEANDKPRPLVIRTNTLKARRKDLAQSLIKRGVNLEPLAKWTKVGLKIIESTVPIGATPEYLAGHYTIQSASSLAPVIALAPLPDEKVLDMSAAPGGKTGYIAQLMKNTGTVYANDLKRERQNATVANLQRLGVTNAIICCYDGKEIPRMMNNFDRCLLDAPCSGTGVIARDNSIKMQRKVKDILNTSQKQKELLLAAIDSVNAKSKTGGVIVYSTCSVTVEENENVVQFALSRRNVKLIETGLEFGKPGFTRYKDVRFHPSMALTTRFFPHTHNMDGFFVAKFQKFANGPRVDHNDNVTVENEEEGELEQPKALFRTKKQRRITLRNAREFAQSAAEQAMKDMNLTYPVENTSENKQEGQNSTRTVKKQSNEFQLKSTQMKKRKREEDEQEEENNQKSYQRSSSFKKPYQRSNERPYQRSNEKPYQRSNERSYQRNDSSNNNKFGSQQRNKRPFRK